MILILCSCSRSIRIRISSHFIFLCPIYWYLVWSNLILSCLTRNPSEREPGEAYSAFKRKMVFKPHNAPILDASFSPSSPLFATAGGDGTVFFFDVRSRYSTNNSWIPLKFIRITAPLDVFHRTLPPSLPSLFHRPVCEKLSWRMDSRTGDTAVCTCSDGVLREHSIKELIKTADELSLIVELSTYETTVSTVERIIRLPVGFGMPFIQPITAISISTRSNSVAINMTSTSNSLKELITSTQVNGLLIPLIFGNITWVLNNFWCVLLELFCWILFHQNICFLLRCGVFN